MGLGLYSSHFSFPVIIIREQDFYWSEIHIDSIWYQHCIQVYHSNLLRPRYLFKLWV